MYECPNCGGNLVYDIKRRKMYCEHCKATQDPYSITKEQDAEEHSEEYEVTVFTCPQCGGELISEDTTAATFCSFCGSATILDSRVSKEKRPAKIIPFAKTKEDCKAAYAQMMRKAIFAPKELRKEEHIEKFRGIYMPYWVYSFSKDGKVGFPGKKTRRRGDYVYTYYYQISCDIQEHYEGLAYDASASFSDRLSAAIAPFDVKKGKEFTPAFLSGFYADAGDVDKATYEYDAEKIMVEDACNRLAKHSANRKYDIDPVKLADEVRPTEKSAELAMFPVWFLAYRNGDRISYAVVNGQTGKAAADIPIDFKRYALGSLVLTIPLFLFLNLFFTVIPSKMLWVSVFAAAISLCIAAVQISRLQKRASGEDDKGLAYAQFDPDTLVDAMADGRERLAQEKASGNGATVEKSAQEKAEERERKDRKRETRRTLAKPIGGILAALVILLSNPVSDWFYYIGAILCMGSVLWAIMDIVRHHNELTTRKIPQFNRRGGDENA